MVKKKTKKTPARRKPASGRQTIRARHWKKSTTIAKEKFDQVSRAVLKVLGSQGMRWGHLVDRVDALVPNFQGSIWWYTISVLRELETQGKVKREKGPPVLYSKRPKK